MNDGKNNQIIKAVTYSTRISSDQSGVVSLFADTFYSSSGPIVLDITYDEMLPSTTVVANRDAYLDVWAADENGLVKIKTPVLKQKNPYFLHVEILGAESPSSFFSEEVVQKFDFYLSPEDAIEKVVVPEFPMLAIAPLAIPFFVIIAFMRSGRLAKNR